MYMKIYSRYSLGEGFYTVLCNKDSLVFLNTVFPCSIKDLYKSFIEKKEHKLNVISVRSFIKLSALRDYNYLLSFFYPRGFVAKCTLKDIIGKDNFSKFEASLRDLGEIVAIKISSSIIVTVNFWKNCLYYGFFLDYRLLIILLVKVLIIFLSFNYKILCLFSSLTLINNKA